MRAVVLLMLAAGGAWARDGGHDPGHGTPRSASEARARMEQAERDRAASLAAREAAAARAAAAAQEAANLSAARVAAASRLRAAEEATSAVAQRMDALADRQRAAQAALAQRAADLAPLLPLIERLSLFPAETLLAVPAPPEAALRGVLVLQGLGARLEQEARALRAEQAEVAQLEAALREQAPALAAARARQAAEAAALDQELTRTEAVHAAAETEAAAALRRAAEDAERAGTLRTAIATLDADRRAAEARAAADAARAARSRQAGAADAARRREEALAEPAGPSLLSGDAAPRGQMTAPVVGTVVRRWGEPTPAGPADGISWQAAPAARVLSPCAGRVEFAAPFRSYGLLVILDCGGGYHAVLAGLNRLSVQTGARLAAGEPLGIMGDWDPRAPGPRPRLYLEVRRGDVPVDPGPWLRTPG